MPLSADRAAARGRRPLPDGVQPRRVRPARAGRRRRLGRPPADFDGAALVVLPGSKHVAADLEWLRARRLDRRDRAPARAAGGRILAICGGLQILGERVRRSGGRRRRAPGSVCCPLRTTFQPAKLSPDDSARGSLRWPGPGARSRASLSTPTRSATALSHPRHGPSRPPMVASAAVAGPVLASRPRRVRGSGVVEALLGSRLARELEATFDALAGAVDEHLDMQRVGESGCSSAGPARGSPPRRSGSPSSGTGR